jgi:hypothetical protein
MGWHVTDKIDNYLQFDDAELICRMAEAYEQSTRPDGMTASEAVDALPDDCRKDWLRVARAVNRYIAEVIARSSVH